MCEVQEDRLQEVEQELTGVSRGVVLDLSVPVQLDLLFVSAGFADCCDIDRANVVVDSDGSQKRGVAPAVRGGGTVR